MKPIAMLMLNVICLGAFSSYAAALPTPNPFLETLNQVTAAEMPAKAAQLVAEAQAPDREARTTNVVKAAVGLNPAAAPVIVGTIATRVPDMASVAAGTAATEQPKQASAVASAAAAAAPSQAGKIVAAVCRAIPSDYLNIAVAVSQAAPGADKEILNALASALPDLKPSIDSALAGHQGTPLVSQIISQVRPSPTAPRPATVPATSGPVTGSADKPLPATLQPSTKSPAP
jgi:hypothetical protein